MPKWSIVRLVADDNGNAGLTARLGHGAQRAHIGAFFMCSTVSPHGWTVREGASPAGNRDSQSVNPHSSARPFNRGPWKQTLSRSTTMPIHLVPVYDPATSAVSEAIVLNPKQLSALASWLCDRTCSYDSRARDAEIEHNGGYCDDCRDTAGFLMAECPFIDMDSERGAHAH